MTDFCMVYVPVPDEETGTAIAKVAVGERLAACANLFPAGVSIYEWEGKMCVESERVLLLKTSNEKYPALSDRIKGIHPYSVPAIIQLPVLNVNGEYSNWMRQILNP